MGEQLVLFRLKHKIQQTCFVDIGQRHQKLAKMKIYEDVFTGDEMFSDTYPIKLVENCLWELTGKHISRTQDDIQLEGSNASAEEADEGTDAASESGVDIVLNHRLVETGFSAKKDFTVYLKDYMKKVIKYLEENERGGEVEDFKKNINSVMKTLVGKFKDLAFYSGESMDPDAMICMCEYKEVNGEERPVLMFFKHGLRKKNANEILFRFFIQP